MRFAFSQAFNDLVSSNLSVCLSKTVHSPAPSAIPLASPSRSATLIGDNGAKRRNVITGVEKRQLSRMIDRGLVCIQ